MNKKILIMCEAIFGRNSGFVPYAFIRETEVVSLYDTCVDFDWWDRHPENKAHYDKNFILIGSGYIYGQDIDGNMWQDTDLHLFYKYV